MVETIRYKLWTTDSLKAQGLWKTYILRKLLLSFASVIHRVIHRAQIIIINFKKWNKRKDLYEICM